MNPIPDIQAKVPLSAQQALREKYADLYLNTYWIPQPGPQAFAGTCPVPIIFYGGTRGGGKTDTIVGRQLRGAEKYGPHWNGLILRRKFKEFNELRLRIDGLIRQGMPAVRIGGDQQTNFVRFSNGAQFMMTAVMRLDLADFFQGQQYCEIDIDEAPNFHFIAQLLEKLKGCNRSPYGVPCHIFLTGNPGGPGSSIIKHRFIAPAPPGTVLRDPESGEVSVFIKSRLEDNKILIENDPEYVQRLRSIRDPALRAAWLEGNWDVFVGQAFNFGDPHICVPFPVPEYSPIYMTLDWGYGAPFSIGWWHIDADGRLYRFAEWYGWDKTTPNVGLRLSDSVIGLGIFKREERMGIHKRKNIIRFAGPDCFSKKPNYQGGGQGPSTSTVFRSLRYTCKDGTVRLGATDLVLRPGDPDRKLKIRQFRERLVIPEDGTAPMVQVYNTCRDFIRIIPTLCQDDLNIEDIDTDQEDHPYDEACHIFMARPLRFFQFDEEQAIDQARLKIKKEGEVTGAQIAVWKELDALKEHMKQIEEDELEGFMEFMDEGTGELLGDDEELEQW